MRRLCLPVLACVLALAPVPAPAVEHLYSARVYPHLQPLVTRASNTVPVACLDLLVVMVGAGMLVGGVRAWRRTRGRGARTRDMVLLLAQCAAATYIVFLFVWGFNYRRAPADERMQVSRDRVTSERLERLGTLAVARVNALYDPARQRRPARGRVTAGDPGARVRARGGRAWLDVAHHPGAAEGVPHRVHVSTIRCGRDDRPVRARGDSQPGSAAVREAVRARARVGASRRPRSRRRGQLRGFHGLSARHPRGPIQRVARPVSARATERAGASEANPHGCARRRAARGPARHWRPSPARAAGRVPGELVGVPTNTSAQTVWRRGSRTTTTSLPSFSARASSPA